MCTHVYITNAHTTDNYDVLGTRRDPADRVRNQALHHQRVHVSSAGCKASARIQRSIHCAHNAQNSNKNQTNNQKAKKKTQTQHFSEKPLDDVR